MIKLDKLIAPRIFKFTLLTTIVIVLTTSCTQSPTTVVRQLSHEMALTQKTSVKRHRQVVLSANNHIGLLVTTNIDNLSASSRIESLFKEEGIKTFNQTFSQVSVINNKQLKPSSIDFLVQIELLDTNSNIKPKPVNSEKETSLPASKRHYNQFAVKPYSAMIKIVLVDARNNQELDVAFVKSRSGVIVYEGYKGFLGESLRAYARTLISHHPKNGQQGITY